MNRKTRTLILREKIMVAVVGGGIWFTGKTSGELWLMGIGLFILVVGAIMTLGED